MRPTWTILIADDDEYIRDTLAEYLQGTGHLLLFSETADQTWRMIQGERPELVLLDIRFPDCQDLSLLRRIRQGMPQIEVIVISSQIDDVSLIVGAIKEGAYDCVPKPVVREELLNRVGKALDLRGMGRTHEILLRQIQARGCLEHLVGGSRTMDLIRETIGKYAGHSGCVLVRGESGTGKELAACALHFLGPRRSSPFVVVNCAAIPEALVESELFGHRRGAFTGAVESTKGKFEEAGDGTLFLDEICDMPFSQQAALLRVLETRRFTPVGEARERMCGARFVLATNRDLFQLVREGTFREDLFYRVRVATVLMPPLRAHQEDIPSMVETFCAQFALEMGRPPVRLCSRVLKLFQRYDWPGNVRELTNVVEASMMLLDPKQQEMTIRDLPAELLVSCGERPASEGMPGSQDRLQRRRLVKALREAGGNQSKAAKLLGCHRNTVRTWIRHYGIVNATQ